jgi:hypothetical protein
VRSALALVCAFAVAPAATAVSTDRVELRSADCRDAPAAILDMMDAKWQHWRHWSHIVQICPLHAPAGRLALLVLTLRYDLFHAEGVPGSELDPNPIAIAPDPYILDLQGRVLGELPEGFPTNGAVSTVRVDFADWHGIVPHRVDIHVSNNAVFGTYDAQPLFWHADKQRYESSRP